MINSTAIIRVCFLFFGAFLMTSTQVSSQVYVEKQTRHRFAQMNFGIDYFRSLEGESSFLDSQGMLQSFQLEPFAVPRLIIGGTHFWGHADFTVSFPLASKPYVKDGQEISFISGLDTSFKVYPWKIKHGRVAPYIGVALSGYSFQQTNTLNDNGVGPQIEETAFPAMAGLTYNYKNHLLELGVSRYLANKTLDYYITDTYKTEVYIPSTFVNVSYRYMLDTSLSAERDWESGDTQKLTEKLNENGDLNGLFVSAGPSSAFPFSIGKFNQEERPYFGTPSLSFFLEYALGYYLHNPDLNFSVTYRGYDGSNEAFHVLQETGRRSIGFEVTKMLGDYHGFIPFIGPTISMEQLSFVETKSEVVIHDVSETKIGYGITFGWDIRPNRIQPWLLRTNLRWTPSLNLDVSGDQNVAFGALEFNFIQLVIFPGRFKALKQS